MSWVNAVLQGILTGGLYALFATGLSVAFGVMRFVNLAHGDLAVFAAFTAFSLSRSRQMNALLTLVVLLPAAFLVGYAMQRLVFDRVIGVDPAYQIVATFGLAVVIQNGLLRHYTADDRGLKIGKLDTASIRINEQISIGWLPLLTFGCGVAVLGGLALFLRRTKTGRAFRATSDDDRAAQLMGIDNRRVYGVAMAISFATVALAGVLNASRSSFTPFKGPELLIYAFEAVIIGGLGSLWGTLVGGIALGVAQGLGTQVSPQWGPMVGHIVFMAVLATRPTGLFGTGEVR